MRLKPQPGPQTAFLSSAADIAIYGGAAGGGKTFGLLLEPLRHLHNAMFKGVIFRREMTQIKNDGGLWDESSNLYPLAQGKPIESKSRWVFPSGMSLRFAHLEHEKTKYNWQGAQIAFAGFDEVTHFTETQFFYILSRLRSMSGVKGYIRATCNPDASSWVRRFIDYWIGPDGLPIPERSGRVRWFIRMGDDLIWADTAEELIERYSTPDMTVRPMSVTFIAATIQDNQILMKKDPQYMANLMALPRVDRERLLGGNWDIMETAGEIFKRSDFEIVDGWDQSDIVTTVRGWDRAGTAKTKKNKPDWTAGVKISKTRQGLYIVRHVERFQKNPDGVDAAVRRIAESDGRNVRIKLEQEPGSSGKKDIQQMTRLLSGFIVGSERPSSDKVTRSKPFASQCQAGNVKLVKGPWVEAYLKELENFPNPAFNDDQIDASSLAFNDLAGRGVMPGIRRL